MMPARNAAATIGAAIASVRAQSFSDFELVVLDDGSTDSTADAALAASAGDPRITVLRSPALGRGRARNLCLANLRGSLVAVCDADDISLPDRFADQVKALNAPPSADCVSSSRVISFSGDRVLPRAAVAPTTHEDIVRTLNNGRMPILFASAMFRRTLIDEAGGFDPELQRNQDFGFFLRVRHRARFATLPHSTILYRTQGVLAPWHLIRENNQYRRLAWLRAAGSNITMNDYRRSVGGRVHNYLLVPMQFGWHLLRSSLRGSSASALTPEEYEFASRYLETVLRA
jgi:glycosyltransferase involved in cell wall biosynthesis